MVTRSALTKLALIAVFGLAVTVEHDARASRLMLTEAQMCRAADWVVIGRVEARESFRDPNPLVDISTIVTFETEVVAHGNPPPHIKIKTRGGELDGERDAYNEEWPAALGGRYLLLIGTHGIDEPYYPMEPASAQPPGVIKFVPPQGPGQDDPQRQESRPQGGGSEESSSRAPRGAPPKGPEYTPHPMEQAALDDMGLLVGVIEWFELSPTGDPPPDQLLEDVWKEHCDPELRRGDTAPTQGFIPFIPKWWLAWCEHY